MPSRDDKKLQMVELLAAAAVLARDVEQDLRREVAELKAEALGQTEPKPKLKLIEGGGDG